VPDSPLSALRRVLGDERGLALPMALGVMLVLSLLTAGIFTYTTMNQGAAKRATADQHAFGLAESGLSYAFSKLENASDSRQSVGAWRRQRRPYGERPGGGRHGHPGRHAPVGLPLRGSAGWVHHDG
jgi:Tfp pilus assembly protein PilX